MISKRKNASVSEKDKGIATKNPQPEAAKPQVKKQRTEKVSLIQPSNFYPPKTQKIEESKDQPMEILDDPIEAAAIEAHSEKSEIVFLVHLSSRGTTKADSKGGGGGKKVLGPLQKTGEFLVIGPVPTKRVDSLMDVIDEDEELNYIDNGTPMETSEKEHPVLKSDKAKVDPAIGEGQSSGLKPNDPLDLDSSDVEKPTENQSRSPPPGWQKQKGLLT
jgi:hypothetical protein